MAGSMNVLPNFYDSDGRVVVTVACMAGNDGGPSWT